MASQRRTRKEAQAPGITRTFSHGVNPGLDELRRYVKAHVLLAELLRVLHHGVGPLNLNSPEVVGELVRRGAIDVEKHTAATSIRPGWSPAGSAFLRTATSEGLFLELIVRRTGRGVYSITEAGKEAYRAWFLEEGQ